MITLPYDFKVWQNRPPYDEVDALYKTPDCSDHTYYVATKRPNGNWISLGRPFKLAGLQHNPEWVKNFTQFFLVIKDGLYLEEILIIILMNTLQKFMVFGQIEII